MKDGEVWIFVKTEYAWYVWNELIETITTIADSL